MAHLLHENITGIFPFPMRTIGLRTAKQQKHWLTIRMAHRTKSGMESGRLPIMIETPDQDEAMETLRARGYDLEAEKLKANVRYNPIVGMVEEERSISLGWCACQNCSSLTHPRECCCCWEYRSAKHPLAEYVENAWEEGAKCLADTIAVQASMDEKNLLFAIEVQEKERRRKKNVNVDKSRQLRHMAYRRCIFALFGKREHTERIILPSCVVTSILRKYPPTEKRQGFEFAFAK